VTISKASEGPLPPLGTAGVVVLASALFAVSFGFNFGVGNQTLYLLPAMKLLDPELFARDWTYSHATQYHQAFAYLGALLFSLDPRGWGVALGLTVAIFSGTVSLYALGRSLVGHRLALPSFLLLVSLLLLTRTSGPATTYLFDGTLQPSAVASTFLLGAAAAFVGGRFGLSGVLLGASSLFHINFSVLSVGAFGLSQLALGREGLGRRLLAQLAPAVVVLLAFSPMLLGATGSGADAKLGREIYLYVRAPHHFVLSDKVPEFFPLVGWSLIAWGITRPLVDDGEHGAAFRRFAACALGLAAIVWLGVAAALVSDGARQLFSWRIAPHAEVVLEAGSLAGAARLAAEPGHGGRFGWRRLLAVALGLTAVFAGWAAQGRSGPIQVVALITLGVALSLLSDRSLVRGRAAWNAFRERFGPRALALLGAMLLIGFAVRPLSRIARYSSLLRRPPATEDALYRFMLGATDKSAVFLTPPDLEGARLFGRRAVVVDWQGTPALPVEALTWYRRLEDVTGRPGFRSAADLAGYDAIDPPRFEHLHARYGFDYAVIRRSRAGAFGSYEKRYENADFVVLRSRSGGSTIAAP
jgi:hypothetical protein